MMIVRRALARSDKGVCRMLAIVLVIAAVIVIALFIWGAVKLKAIEMQREIMRDIIKEGDEWDE